MERTRVCWLILSSTLLLSGVQSRDRACDMLVAIDQNTVFPSDVPKNDDIVRTVHDYVESVNDVYKDTILKNPPNENIYLRLKDVWIIENLVPDCNNESVLLHQFSRSFDFSQYCLAHLLTYRDFGCIVGLGTVRGLCRKSDNTAFTKSNMLPSDKNHTVKTMAHEIGHNFGSAHDGQNTSAYSSCDPKKYIMGEAETLKFSYCSLQAMQHRLHSIIEDTELMNNCFKLIDEETTRRVLVERKVAPAGPKVACPVNRGTEHDKCQDFDPPDPPEPPPEPECGDGKLDHPEECDCGKTHEECADPCCYPAILSEYDLQVNASAKPCTRFIHHPCSARYWSPLVFGLAYSWAFIFILGIIIGLILFFDWKGRRNLYGHILHHEDDIRINIENRTYS